VNDEGGPLVIAGVGGSGTRVFAGVARAAGRHMGDHVNESGDALELMAFADRWIGPYHAARAAGTELQDVGEMRRELEASAARHRGDTGGPWGWKQPRSIHFLPFLHETFPGLRFLHVIRDCRDVAFGNQAPTVLENAGDAILGPGWRSQPVPVALAELWAVANELAADYGEGAMGGAYLRVRFEDLCLDPTAVAAHVARFAGGDPSAAPVAAVAARVGWPRSIGAWRRADPAQREAVQRAGDSALRRFGYASTRFRRPLAARLRSATRRLRPS
jgi:Sulfotransferase family